MAGHGGRQLAVGGYVFDDSKVSFFVPNSCVFCAKWDLLDPLTISNRSLQSYKHFKGLIFPIESHV